MRKASSYVAIALDNMERDDALRLVSQIGGTVATFKIHSLWDGYGMSASRMLLAEGAASVWIDLKIEDTPETATDRARRVKESGASFLTVHIRGGKEMMQEAIKTGPATIVGITELTSLTAERIERNTGKTKDEAILMWARDAVDAGLPAIVCSPKDLTFLRAHEELSGLKFFTPGIKAADAEHSGQARTDTPANAIRAGSDMLVLGRIVTAAGNPVSALERIFDEIEEALEQAH